MSFLGAVPFKLTGEIPSYIDAIFEMISGFTTTGASILTDVESLSQLENKIIVATKAIAKLKKFFIVNNVYC